MYKGAAGVRAVRADGVRLQLAVDAHAAHPAPDKGAVSKEAVDALLLVVDAVVLVVNAPLVEPFLVKRLDFPDVVPAQRFVFKMSLVLAQKLVHQILFLVHQFSAQCSELFRLVHIVVAVPLLRDGIGAKAPGLRQNLDHPPIRQKYAQGLLQGVVKIPFHPGKCLRQVLLPAERGEKGGKALSLDQQIEGCIVCREPRLIVVFPQKLVQKMPFAHVDGAKGLIGFKYLLYKRRNRLKFHGFLQDFQTVMPGTFPRWRRFS